MSDFIIICLFSFFAVIGIYSIIFEAYKTLHKKIPLCITIHIRDFINEPEYTVRSFFLHYPTVELIIVDDNKHIEASKILECLSMQYPLLNIKHL